MDTEYHVVATRHMVSAKGTVGTSSDDRILAQVVALSDGFKLRGALAIAIQSPLEAVRLDQAVVDWCQSVALDFLDSACLPRHWVDSLSAFLRVRTVVIPSGEDLPGRIVLSLREQYQLLIQHGAYPDQVWDACRGRSVSIQEIELRSPTT
jgi:hypothetical protein